jgi:hypothetical protein
VFASSACSLVSTSASRVRALIIRRNLLTFEKAS